MKNLSARLKSLFSRHFVNSPRGIKKSGLAMRASRRHRALGMESLEGRAMLSLTPQLVLDINTNTLGSSPSEMVTIGSTTYFTADDGVHGRELWKSDGTAAGTVLVKDINPGSASSDIVNLTNFNGSLYFTASSDTNGGLWKSDGTAAGTVFVKAVAGYSFTIINGTLFFVEYQESTGYELWKSDGTAAGTVLLKDIKPGWESSNPSNLTNVNGTLFFTSIDYFDRWHELWKSDGTAAGTVLVKDIATKNLTNVNGTLYFTGYTATTGEELWKSDGTTAGTVLVMDIVPGDWSSSPGHLTDVNGTLFFSTYPWGLWKSDGTAAGTTLVKAIYYPSNLTNVNGTLFFSPSDPVYGSGLWKSDGTEAGTVQVSSTGVSTPTNVNGILYFAAYPWNANGTPSFDNTWDLWKSDGTEAGTVVVKEFLAPDPYAPVLASLSNVNGTLFVSADDGRSGIELWKSNGTAAGTVLVKDINPSSFGSNPRYQTDVNGTLFFSADDGVHGYELWKSDGTVAGTTLVRDIFPGSYWDGNGYSSFPKNLTNVNGTLFFTARSSGGGSQLWKSDGTEAGTVPTGFASFVDWAGASNLTNVNGTLFFTGGDEYGSNQELWKSDGTAAGTVMVKDIYPGSSFSYYDYWGNPVFRPNSSNPSNLTNVGGTLYFVANDGTNGLELWKSDGTAAGTVLVKDIYPGSANSHPSYLTNFNGTLFFSAYDGTNGWELWKSDGTAAGTVLVKDIYPGSANSHPSSLTNVNGTLFFSAYDGTNGWELWKSDGTAAGTVLLKDINPGANGGLTQFTPFAVGGSTPYFTANDGASGIELWKSDGTAAGTVLVKDINPGSGSTSFLSWTTRNGTLIFAAGDGVNPPQVWQTDGTSTGTVVVADVAAYSLINVNGTVFFSATDGELWKLIDDAAPPSITIYDALVTEGNTGTRAANFTVRLSEASVQPVTVTFATADGTASAGSDYKATSGTLTFAPGEISKPVTVLVIGDGLGEPSETFFLNLSSPTNATIDDGQGLGTIVDDEPSISISDAQGFEGNTGTVALTFTVSLSTTSDAPVTVNYTTANGTATAGSDYQATSGTLSIPAGQTTGTITVPVTVDYLGEPNETFFLNLSSPTNAAINDGQGLGTIVDDEPRITISDAQRAEGNTGTVALTFTVSLSNTSDAPVTVNYTTANGTAAADSDYQATSGTLSIPAGQTTGTITVLVIGDRLPELDETFVVNLSTPTNGIISDGQGVATIIDDEPRISISDVSTIEGRVKKTTLFVFTVTLSVAYDQPVTMSFQTVDGTATTGNNDYVAKTGTLTFAPGETTKTITIEVKGDSKKEANESFYLDLFGLSSNALFTKNRGIGTILNDD